MRSKENEEAEITKQTCGEIREKRNKKAGKSPLQASASVMIQRGKRQA